MTQRNLARRGMSLREWNDTQTEELVLPSGLGVVLQRFSLTDLAMRGSIPTPLVGVVEEMINGKGKDEFQIADMPQFNEMTETVIQACLLEPPLFDRAEFDLLEAGSDVAQDYIDTHLRLEKLKSNDRIFIFNWANGAADKLAPFRAEPGERDLAGRDSAAVRAETVVDSEN